MSRSVARALSLAFSLGLVSCTGMDVGQDQNELRKPQDPPSYLALGDSVPFGANPLISPANNPNKYVGYSKLVAGALNLRELNASCPGETSASMWDAAAVDDGCDAFKAGEDLHVDYAGTQFDYAMEYVATHERVQLVTVQLGVHDIFLMLNECVMGGGLACVTAHLPATLATVNQNLRQVVGSLRAAGYTGQVILPTYYSPDYTDDLLTYLASQINDVIVEVAAATGAQVADGFGALQAASESAGGDACAAGLLIPGPDGGCELYPSALGAQVLADAITAVATP